MATTPFPTSTGFVTATSTSSLTFLRLTTQFAPQETSCAEIFSQLSSIWVDDSNGLTELLQDVYVSDSKDPRFASCQPSGWDRVASSNQLTFSPGVCPMSWTAYHLGLTEKTEYKTKFDYDTYYERSYSYNYTDYLTITTAYCCASGYKLNTEGVVTSVRPAVRPGSNPNLPSPACVASTTASGPGQAHATITRVHQPYKVMWQREEGAALLSPPAPTNICSEPALGTYVPGTPGETMHCSKSAATQKVETARTTKIVAALVAPIIGAILLGLAMYFFWWRRRGRGKKGGGIQEAPPRSRNRFLNPPGRSTNYHGMGILSPRVRPPVEEPVAVWRAPPATDDDDGVDAPPPYDDLDAPVPYELSQQDLTAPEPLLPSYDGSRRTSHDSRPSPSG